MSAAKDLARKRKNYTMGDYMAAPEEQEAYLWGVRNNLRIAPKCCGPKQWYVEIFLNGKWNHNGEVFGPVEVWKQIYNYYIYYYGKRSK